MMDGLEVHPTEVVCNLTIVPTGSIGPALMDGLEIHPTEVVCNLEVDSDEFVPPRV